MNIVIFDTETTSIDKPFCYNIGYIIGNEYGETLVKREFVVEQIWHNLPLFNTAYYANKRPIYIERMRAKKIVLDKFGYICRQMARDFKQYNVECAYAYNSPFDTKVFEFNCDWFKCNNPFDTIPILDIRANVHEFLITDDFLEWCEKHNEFTESGNYSTTAETMTRYITDNGEFNEEHTALADSEIEYKLLLETLARNGQLGVPYQVKKSIERKVEKTLTIIDTDKNTHTFNYYKMRTSKTKNTITLS